MTFCKDCKIKIQKRVFIGPFPHRNIFEYKDGVVCRVCHYNRRRKQFEKMFKGKMYNAMLDG